LRREKKVEGRRMIERWWDADEGVVSRWSPRYGRDTETNVDKEIEEGRERERGRKDGKRERGVGEDISERIPSIRTS
jgi:hypothetical protein